MRRACVPQETISLEDRTRWDGALEAVPHSFHHTWDFAHAAQLTTRHRTLLYRFSHRGRLLLCPLIERPVGDRVDVATPSGLAGFVGDAHWPDFAPHWREFVNERAWVTGYIGLHPLFEPPSFTERCGQHNSVYALDLRLGRAELMRRMDRNRRRELRGWETRAKSLVTDRDAISRFLLDTYEPFMRRVGARPERFGRETLDRLCHSDGCLCVGAGSSAGLEAVYLFGATRYAGECLISVATPRGRRHMTDLLWYGVSELIDRGIPVLNLGGGVRENDSIARAKQRFRPRRLPLRALKQVYRPDEYLRICRSAGVDAEASSSYFPAYRASSVQPASEAT